MMTVSDFWWGMREHFKIENPDKYLDKALVHRKQVFLDVVKFDEWLHKAHGEYEQNGQSMRDVVHQEYGLGALLFIEKLL